MRRNLLLPALALALTGCVGTEHPLFTEADAVAEPLLEGEWQAGDTTYRVHRAGLDPTSYRVVAIQDGDEGLISEGPLLFRLGRRYFIAPNNGREFFPLRVAFSGADLRAWEPDTSWLQAHLRDHPEALKHAIQPAPGLFGETGRLLLRAETRDLKRFVRDHFDELFAADVVSFLRVGGTRLPLVAGDGPASLRQRTFDYWDEVRAVLAPLRRHPGANPADTAATYEQLADRIGDIPTELLDPDAVEAAREQAAALAALAQCLGGKTDSGQAVPGPILRRVQRAFEVAERARDRLERRYGWTFPPLRWELPE